MEVKFTSLLMALAGAVAILVLAIALCEGC